MKTLVAVVAIQLIYAGYFVLTKVAFDVGMNTFVFVFYRQAVASLFLAPIAIFFEWKTAPRLSFSIFIKIFMLSLFGITMSLDMVGIGLKYTCASLGAAATNTLPVITFFLALVLRMEKVNIRRREGMMKVGGVVVCIAGAATIAFYRGPYLKPLLHHHLINTQLPSTNPNTATWIQGVALILLSNFTWAFWLLLQGRVLKAYPSKLLFTTLQCFTSTIQSFLVALIFARDPAQWKLGWSISLLSVAYCGIVVTGVAFYLQAMVVEKKGPVFLSMTTPLIFLFTIIISAFILGEIISLGSVVGAVVLVGGLYFVLWGKTKEEERSKMRLQPNGDVEKASQLSNPHITLPSSNLK
ncbi:WAT1-related protein At5g64700 [Sesamum indicum]|uniref:WAT1-related protein n=1 Tax=Sesamum indicum TaxID=4182 RepID=A0A6I9V0A6_SESIN|nr:WAT1-related protein At5g64700 [Sesamum indicum]